MRRFGQSRFWLAGLLWLVVALPLAAAPKVSNGMRWAHSWAEATDEAKLRNCGILVHIYNDTDSDSLAMYPMYGGESFCRACDRLVHIVLVKVDDKHPFSPYKNEDGETVQSSRVFVGLTKENMAALLDKRDDRYKLPSPFKVPSLLCFQFWGGDPLFEDAGMIKEAQFRVRVEEAVQRTGDKSIVPIEDYLTFRDGTKQLDKQIADGQWSAAVTQCATLKKTFKKYPSLTTRADELTDSLNGKGLAQIDTALDLADMDARKKELKRIATQFAPLDAAARAQSVLDRYK